MLSDVYINSFTPCLAAISMINIEIREICAFLPKFADMPRNPSRRSNIRHECLHRIICKHPDGIAPLATFAHNHTRLTVRSGENAVRPSCGQVLPQAKRRQGKTSKDSKGAYVSSM